MVNMKELALHGALLLSCVMPLPTDFLARSLATDGF